MLKYQLIHPPLLAALASSGHGDQVLLADSNFPVVGKCPPQAEIIYLNLAPGVLSVTGVLKVLLDAANFESAAVMIMDTGQEAPIVTEFRSLLPAGTKFDLLGRQEFYQAVSSPKTTVIIATGEQRLYANLLLTVGVVKA